MPTVSSHGLDVYYEVHGDGPPVLFAHGAGGNTLIWWQQVQHFAREYRVIVIDHRGFGRSVGAAGADVFQPVHFADDVRAILDAEGVDRAALVCQSMGGWTGVQTALTSPDRVAALVLIGTPGGIVTDGVLQALTAAQRKRVADGATLLGLVVAPDFPEREPALAHLYEQISALNPERFTEKLQRLAELTVSPDALGEWTIPTLVLGGEHDAFFPPSALQEVAAAIPGARFQEFPGSGHSIYFEQAAAFNAAVSGFLAEQYAAV